MKTLKNLFFFTCILGTAGCTHLFFQPDSRLYMDPAANREKYEVIRFNSGDGTELTGMFFPSNGAPRGTVVHFHGNAQNMTAHFAYSSWLAKEGFNVFIFDYRGYGASKGRPELAALVEDGLAAIRQARKLPGTDPRKIIIFGQSLGGAIAIAALAADDGPPPAAMILEGTFYSYRSVAGAILRRHWWSWPLAWFPWLSVTGNFSPSDRISRLEGPKLFIHSKTDPIVPFSQGRRLFEAAQEPKAFWTIPSGHIDAFYGQREIYGPRLVEFIEKALRQEAVITR